MDASKKYQAAHEAHMDASKKYQAAHAAYMNASKKYQAAHAAHMDASKADARGVTELSANRTPAWGVHTSTHTSAHAHTRTNAHTRTRAEGCMDAHTRTIVSEKIEVTHR